MNMLYMVLKFGSNRLIRTIEPSIELGNDLINLLTQLAYKIGMNHKDMWLKR